MKAKKLGKQIDTLERQISNIESIAEKKVEALQARLDKLYEASEQLDDAAETKRKAARVDVVRLASRVLRKLDDKDATALANAIELLV